MIHPKDELGLYIPDEIPMPSRPRSLLHRWWRLKREVRAHYYGMKWWMRIHHERVEEVGVVIIILASFAAAMLLVR